MAGDSSSSDSQSDNPDASWIGWFVSCQGHEFFCEVDESYIVDRFNLTGLSEAILHYRYAIAIILDSEMDIPEEITTEVQRSAETLYGMIHARFILTAQGMKKMMEKYRNGYFGMCPRIACESQKVLPVGLTACRGMHSVKLFCPKCMECYQVKSAKHRQVDGAFFGPTFAPLATLTHPEDFPVSETMKNYVPKIYGFRIHPSAFDEHRGVCSLNSFNTTYK